MFNLIKKIREAHEAKKQEAIEYAEWTAKREAAEAAEEKMLIDLAWSDKCEYIKGVYQHIDGRQVKTWAVRSENERYEWKLKHQSDAFDRVTLAKTHTFGNVMTAVLTVIA